MAPIARLLFSHDSAARLKKYLFYLEISSIPMAALSGLLKGDPFITTRDVLTKYQKRMKYAGSFNLL